MIQGKSLLVFLSALCCHTWLSPLSSFSSDASTVPEDSYYEYGSNAYEPDDPEGIVRQARGPRLRYVKREDDDYSTMISRDTRGPRLRFIKKEDGGFDPMERDNRGPRLRFVKKEDEESDSMFVRDVKEPRLRFIKKEDFDSDSDPMMTRDTRGPRLRFIKRESYDSPSDPFTELETRGPRLRFVKKEPRLRFVKKEPRLRFQKREAIPHQSEDYVPFSEKHISDNNSYDKNRPSSKNGSESTESHTRKRRSAGPEPNLLSISKRRLSINNDLQAITDMVLRDEYNRRQRELTSLYQALRRAGKRSGTRAGPKQFFQPGASDDNVERNVLQKRPLSINNDLQSISNMVLGGEYRRRQRELQNLYDAMRRAGKRSSPLTGVMRPQSASSDNLEESGLLQHLSSPRNLLQAQDDALPGQMSQDQKDLQTLMESLPQAA